MSKREEGHVGLRVLLGCVLVLGAIVITSGQDGEVIKAKGVGGATASTTGTSGSTGSTTSTSTGGSTGDDGTGHNVGYVVLKRLEERLHVNSAWLQGSSITSSTDRHVLKLRFLAPYNSSTTQQSGFNLSHISTVSALAFPQNQEYGGEPNLLNCTPGTITLPNTTTPISCAIYTPPPVTTQPWNFFVHRGSATTLTGGSITFYVKWYQLDQQVLAGEDGPYVETFVSDVWSKIELSVSKLNLETISTDSRRVYGKANLDGELPGDPNADLSSNIFWPWIWKGGHFVGNMPYGSSHDQSGTARSQLRYMGNLPTSSYVASCVTLFNTGTPVSTSAGAIGLYKPNVATPGTSFPQDPFLNEGLEVNWQNKWTLAPGTGSLPANPLDPIDFTTFPLYTVTPAITDVNNYLNWQLPYRTHVNTPRYRGNGADDVPNNFWRHVSLCQNNETLKTWQYFSSQWTEAVPNQQFPLNDSRPRLWWVGVPNAQ